MDLSLSFRFKNAWNAFRNRAPTMMSQNIGSGYSYRPDRFRLTRGNERSIVTSVYNRIALDVAAINIQHVQLDDEGRFLNVIKSGLNECWSLEANLDQTGRAFIQDVVMSMMDEGCVAIVPVDTDDDPDDTKGYQILSMRVGRHLFFLCADIDSFCEPLYILFCNHSIYFCIIDFIHMLFRCQQTVCQISVIRDQK